MNNDKTSDSYSTNRKKWVHEDNLINQRLNWLLMTQTILFAAYGLLLGATDKGIKADDIAKKIDSAVNIIPWIGISVSSLIFLGIVGAVGAMCVLKKQVHEMDLDVAKWTTILGQATGLFLPLVFIVGWLCVA